MPTPTSHKVGIAVYLLMYFVALALLTMEVFRLYGILDQEFVMTLLTNLQSTNMVAYVLVLAIIPLFFLWFGYIVFSQATPKATKEMPMCFLVLAIFLAVAFYAILALVFMAVTFIGMYMGGVGAAVGGYGDAQEKRGIRKFISLFGVYVGMFFELSISGLLDFAIPWLKTYLTFPLPLQESSPDPSGVGIGYYMAMVSILYSLISAVRESWSLRRDVVSSEAIGEQGSLLGYVMNPLFVAFWALATVVLWPLLPFVYLDWGLALLYTMGWITGFAMT